MKKAIIIGAGPAGLTAAYQLLKEGGVHPVVLEATGKIGGISQTIVYNGNRMDIGGHRFFSKNKDVTALWEKLMPLQGAPARDEIITGTVKPAYPPGPDPEKEDNVMLCRNRVSRIFYLGKFFDYPISIKFQTFANMGLARTVKAVFGYGFSIIKKRPENSLEDFYINRFGRPLYKMFFEDYTEKLWGIHPRHIAADWGKQRVKGLSLSKAVLAIILKPFANKKNVETSLIESFIYPKKGPGQYWERMAEEIKNLGGEIIMEAEVVEVAASGTKITGVTFRKNGNLEHLGGDYFFSSMPVKDLVNAMGGTVPADVREIAAALPYRDFITVGLLVRKLRIRNNTKLKTVANIVPDCWIYIQEREVKIGRLQIFNNWSPYMVKDVENTVWIGLEYFCAEGDWMWAMPDSGFIEFATAELAKIGVIDAGDVLDATMARIPKAYPAYFGAYERFGDVRRFLDSFENLYCIGRNGQHRYNNMDHSMLTSMEAVKSACAGSPKENIWNVNTEQEYHESK